jgi:N12 class adenine-specific DNA methylase
MADTNPFADPNFGADAANPFSDPSFGKPSGAIRRLADKAVGFGAGAAGATKAIADVAGAGNPVSGVLDSATRGLNSLLSPEAQADQAQQQAIMAEANGKGLWEGVKAGARAFGVAPVQTAVTGLGSVVPTVAAGLATGGASVPASLATMGAIGLAQGAGTVKGAIYDDVRERSTDAGMSPEDAQAAATRAQEFSGPNAGNIAIGAGLGVGDALTGVTKVATSMLRRGVGKAALAEGSTRGVMARTGLGIAGEMPLEIAQGGQEKYAANVASARQGFDVDPMEGVAAQGTLEGLAAAGPGAAFGAFNKAHPALVTPPPPAAPPAGPMTAALIAGGQWKALGVADPQDDLARQKRISETGQAWQDIAPTTPAEDLAAQKPLEQRASEEAGAAASRATDERIAAVGKQWQDLGITDPSTDLQRQRAGLTPAEERGVDANAGPLSGAAAMALNAGVTQGMEAQNAETANDITDGGTPFKGAIPARRAADKAGEGWSVVKVQDGYVVRPSPEVVRTAESGKPTEPAKATDAKATAAQSAPAAAAPVPETGRTATALSPAPVPAAGPAGTGADANPALKGVPNGQRQGEGTPPAGVGAARVQPGPDRAQPPAVRTEAPGKTADAAGAAGGATQGAKPLTLGSMPNQAEPVTVKDGVIHVGKLPALNFDTGAPIVAPRDATATQIKQLLKDAGAVGNRQRFFGGTEQTSAAQPQSQDTQTPVAARPGPQKAEAGAAAAPAGNTAGVEAAGVARPANWRTNFMVATQVAKSVGIPYEQGRKLADLVAMVDAKDGKAPPNESDQDRSNREFAENYGRVTGNIKASTDKEIDRAIMFSEKQFSNLQPKAWAGDEQAKRMMTAYEQEAEGLKQEQRIRKGQDPVTGKKPVTPQVPPAASANTVFTQDAAAVARALIKARLAKPAATTDTTPAAEVLRGAVDVMPAADKATLEAHYGEKPGTAAFFDRVRDDVATFVNKGAAAIASGIRSIIKSLAEGVLALGIVFNPMGLKTDYSFDLPAVHKQTITQTRQVKAEPPLEAIAGMSGPAITVYENMAPTAKTSGKGFIIADKPAGMMHVFAADGSLIAQDTALYGKDKGDRMGVSSLKGGPKVTPAGGFALRWAESEYAGGQQLELVGSEDADGAVIAVHAAWLGDPKEKRAERLASLTADDNRISYGCINSAHDTFLNKVLPEAPNLDGGMAFVLPDESDAGALFPAGTTTETTTIEAAERNAREGTVGGQQMGMGGRARTATRSGTPPRGLDPELTQAGITMAGFHIEGGSPTFASYARAMLDDLGEAVRPYLKSWYMAVKYDPRAGDFSAKMSTAGFVEEFDLAHIAAPSDSPAVEKSGPSADTGDSNAAATRRLDQSGTSPLEGIPSGDVRAPAGKRPAGAGAAGGRNGDQPGGGRADPAGRDLAGGLGADPGAVPVSPRGNADAAPAGKPGVQGPQGADARPGRAEDAGREVAPNAPPIPAPQYTPPADFTIDAELALGEGGQKTKFRNNVAAITLLKKLLAEGLQASADEQQVLAKYVGWGGLPQAFDANNREWANEHAQLKELLDDKEFSAARRSTRYAHYTSREIIQDGIYAALRRFGFTGGRALEGGAGVGNFIGLMPQDLRAAGRVTAIEREPIAAGIARNLYPNQSVQLANFTEFKGTDGYFDVAIGNPPFASDPQTDRSGRKHLSGLSLHNYFFAKEVDMLREGGILAQVVTNSFLDAAGDKARSYISDRTRFLGAIRLPNNAFSKNAGTEVTTDLIFLQKRPEAEWGTKATRAEAKAWLDVVKVTDARKGVALNINQYFKDHPEMMLGDFGAHGTMYGPDQPALVARKGQDTLAMLKEAVKRLPDAVYVDRATLGTDAAVDAAIKALTRPPVQEGGFFVDEQGILTQRVNDIAGEARGREINAETQWTAKTKLGEAGAAKIRSLAAMRVTLRSLLAAELADEVDKATALRAQLNTQYDGYTKEHGLLNDTATARVFDDDPDFPLLLSLEHNYVPGIGIAAAKRQNLKPTKSTATKSPIFKRRVVDSRKAVQKVETPADALAVSMAERGKLDTAYIGKLLGKAPEDVLGELSTGAKPLLFLDPATDEYVLRDAYLSGNVREKLAQAKAAGLSTNQRALEAVQPHDVGAHEISARVGSPWVPTAVYEDFAKELFGEGTTASIKYVKLNSSYAAYIHAGSDVNATNKWGTKDYSGPELISALLNNRTIKVTWTDKEGTHVDQPATEQANLKAQEIRERFQDWLFSDAARSEVLVRAYNDTNNNYVTREYDGTWMTFPGKVPNDVIKFRRHQRNAIARIVQDRTALLDHVVGAGKTFTVVAAAMELRRTGLARKPMVAVPNHLVKQWAADFYRLYPGANILTATKKDFEKINRRRFLAKIATGDWDAVVIAHSSFGFIKPGTEFEASFNDRQVALIMETIKAVQEEEGDERAKKRTVKQLEGMQERLENRIASLRDKAMDDLLDFEQLGVDQLFVDEAHMFKNLMFSTKMQGVQGLGDAKGSQRAYDMYVKSQEVMEKNGRGQGLVFATGTPVSNSLAEKYHMMRYLMPRQMQELGFQSFDAWANTFASVEQVWMQKPSGDGYKASNRMSNFVNVHELLKMFDQVADTVTMDDIKKAYREENEGKEFPIPPLKTGRRQPVSLVKSPAQEAYMADIAARAKVLESRKGPPQKGEDNILVIMGDARKAAMDVRLVDPDVTEREKGGRIDKAADNILTRYRKFNAVRGTQLVFSDLGTPKKHAQAELKEYDALQARIDAATDDVRLRASLGAEEAQALVDDAEDAQEAMDKQGPDWLTAVKAAQRGFSVYDDLKDALIGRGIPEHEVAFIHDYNTDERKATLFRKVNAGEVRVVIGSTAKMGAGTNVQERAVALHHLDVPWRPSDVEQREGRIERQGNKLLEEIPGFEVEILAYVTQDTLDMRMWQIQEVKLKMINQLRTRQIDRDIDNAFEDMEMSAGEMQAAATGNMDLLLEIQARADIKKLEQKARSFDAQKSDLINRKRSAAARLAQLPAQIKSAEVLAEGSTQYAQAIEKQTAAFSVNLDGTDFTDRQAASAYLLEKIDARIADPDKKPGEDGEPATKAAPLDVSMNGERYTARAKLQEAWSNAAGDRDPIQWQYEGKTYNRRSAIATAIRQPVADALADETQVVLGKIGPFDVIGEGQQSKLWGSMIEVVLSYKGEKMDSTFSAGEKPDTLKMAEQIASWADRKAYGAKFELQHLQGSLRSAQEAAADLEKAEDLGEWPDRPKLEAAREKHKAILARLNGAGAKPLTEAGDYDPAGDSSEAGNTTDVVFSKKPDTASQRAADAATRMQPSAVQQAVSELTRDWLRKPEIVILENMRDDKVPAAVQREYQRQESQGGSGDVQGFHMSGTVYIVSDSMRNARDVQEVLFHESLGHFGMRGFFGKALNPMLEEIVATRKFQVAKKAREYGLDMSKGADRLMAAEEVLAELAQTRPELSIVQRAIAAIRTWLREHVAAFKDLALTDAEIINRFILPARGFVERGTSGKATFTRGPASRPQASLEPRTDRVQFSKKSVLTGQDIPSTWQGPDASKLDDVIYSMQDKHVDTRRVVQAVRAAIGTIDDQQDPYLQEELFHGRAAMATKEFLEKSLRPLLNDLQARKVDMSDLEEYLHNRHAERRNIQVAKVNPAMPDGGSGIKTADARAYLAALPADKRAAYQALAQRVDAINRETRALLVSSGLEKQSTIDAWQAAYGDEYVPLMREDMDNASTGIGQGYSVKGSASKRALGSNKPVANIIANIALQREKTITRAEKRRIGEAVYGLALKAPNPEFWFAVDPKLQQNPANVTAAAIQLISMGLDPMDAASIAKEPTQSYIDPTTKQVTQRINPALRSMNNVLAVRVDGEDKFVFFNQKDERAMRMATALKNLDADQLGTVMGTVAKMTRYFSAINTQYNPIFGVTNITRDVQTALLNLNSTPLKDHKAEVMKHILPALRGIYIDLRDHRAGKQPTSSYAQIFEEFQREGGATGYRDMYANAKDRAEAIADELKAIKQGRAMSVGRGIMGWLSDYNESMENAVRVSAYKVGKEQGLSNQQAASLAKNLTVNFNRKGQVALQAGALYAFFNASVQGTARIAQTVFADGKLSATGQKIMAGGLLLGAMQALLLAAAGFDDDEPPDFVRERSLVFPVGGGKYVSIPMPLGFHVIPNLGRIPTEWAMGGFKNTPKRIGQMVGLFADAFNPMGSAGLSLQTLTPTIIDPLAALSENKDWSGRPIAKKDFDAMHPTAGHTRARDTATPWARLMSYGMNALTGGTDFKPGVASPMPDQIDYLIGQVTGGVGREVGKLSQVASGTLSGEEVPMHKIPLVGRFVGTTEGQSAESSRFYNNLRELGAHKVEIDGLRKENRGAEVLGYIRDNPAAALVPMAERAHREVAKLQAAKRALINKGTPPDQVKFLDMRATSMMKALNERVRTTEGG